MKKSLLICFYLINPHNNENGCDLNLFVIIHNFFVVSVTAYVPIKCYVNIYDQLFGCECSIYRLNGDCEFLLNFCGFKNF